ncbi:hypothetical protein [Hyalangium gracile]|uniref:hypothetical protein n=1 Tax=Hyalangium gracile TaxID=394092 RepID=UPI001CCC38AD|nr:hypothetical protein [Hyalangium gracile]
MRSGALTAPLLIQGRGALWRVLAASGVLLALGVLAGAFEPEAPAGVSVTLERGSREGAQVVRGARPSLGAAAQRSGMQSRSSALQEQDAIAGGSQSSGSLPQQVQAPRGRVRFQTDTQAVLRLVRERQDAIITAFSHRLRDASTPGAASHPADRPSIVTRPLRGPPAPG